MIQLPEDYNENKKYPLLLITQGGSGCIPELQYLYNSPKLKNDFIVAYFQGSDMAGSYHRNFSGNICFEQIATGFNQIISKCSVDTTKIILAGPSSGGTMSIYIARESKIPLRGLLLNFPGIPGNVIPEIGHGFPANFQHHLETSIEFLLKED